MGSVGTSGLNFNDTKGDLMKLLSSRKSRGKGVMGEISMAEDAVRWTVM